MLKRYKSNTGVGYTFPVFPDGREGKPMFISFTGPNVAFESKDTKVQMAVERSKKFEDGLIGLDKGFEKFTEEELGVLAGEKVVDGKPDESKAKTSEITVDDLDKDKGEDAGDDQGENSGDGNANTISVFEEVTEWQAAKDILRGEPYNVAFQSLNTPANILKHADMNGVSFPHLKL